MIKITDKTGTLLISFAFIFFSIMVFVISAGFPELSEGSAMGAKFLPRILAGGIFILSCILIIQNFIKKEPDFIVEVKDKYLLLFIIAFLFIYIFAIEFLGFYVSSFLFLVIVLAILRDDQINLKSLAFNVVLSFLFMVLMYFVFTKLLLKSFPKGIFF